MRNKNRCKTEDKSILEEEAVNKEETFTINPEVAIYPNPFVRDELTINLDGGVETELVVSLFSMRGTRVSSKLYEVLDNQVKVSGLAKGRVHSKG